MRKYSRTSNLAINSLSLVFFVALFIFSIVPTTEAGTVPSDKCSILTFWNCFGFSQQTNSAATAAGGYGESPAPSPTTCACDQVLQNGVCVSNGLFKCADGTCVSQPDHCHCNPRCDECTENCQNGRPGQPVGSGWQCNPSGSTRCADGSCASSCSCNPACAACTQMCVGNQCLNVTGAVLCPDGTCVTDFGASCPSTCKPPCKTCTEDCQRNSCSPSGNKICPNGNCVPLQDTCPAGPSPSPTY